MLWLQVVVLSQYMVKLNINNVEFMNLGSNIRVITYKWQLVIVCSFRNQFTFTVFTYTVFDNPCEILCNLLLDISRRWNNGDVIGSK